MKAKESTRNRYTVDFPGLGTIQFPTMEEVDNFNALLDGFTNKNSYNNLSLQASGSSIDPMVTGEMSLNDLRYPLAPIRFYNILEWEKLGFDTKFNPATKNTNARINDSTVRYTSQDQINKTNSTRKFEEEKKNIKPIAEQKPDGTVVYYTIEEWESAHPINLNTAQAQSTPSPTNFPPDWSCTAVQIDLSATECLSCSMANCTSCVGALVPNTICNMPPSTVPSNFYVGLSYIADPANGIQHMDTNSVRFRACNVQPGSNLPEPSCFTVDGLATTQVHLEFALANIPPGHPYDVYNNMHWQNWQTFLADMIAIGYPGTATDSLQDFIAVLTNDPGLPQFPSVPILGYYGYLGNIVQACAVNCTPIPAAPPTTFTLISCDTGQAIVSAGCPFLCAPSSGGQCVGSTWTDNSDGVISWSIYQTNAPLSGSGASTYFEWRVIDNSTGVIVNDGIYDAAGNSITVTTGTSTVPSGPNVTDNFTYCCWTSDNLPAGSYTCTIFNYSGGGNTYPDMTWTASVGGAKPQPCPAYPPPPPPQGDPPEPEDEIQPLDCVIECGDKV